LRRLITPYHVVSAQAFCEKICAWPHHHIFFDQIFFEKAYEKACGIRARLSVFHLFSFRPEADIFEALPVTWSGAVLLLNLSMDLLTGGLQKPFP
jgi:hypothetical protein